MKPPAAGVIRGLEGGAAKRIETPRLCLLPLAEGDFAPWLACVSDPETARLMGGDFPRNAAEGRALFEKELESGRFYAIHPVEGGEYMGHVCVSAPYPPVEALTSITGKQGASLSYVVAPSYRRRGVASEAVKAMIDWLFREKRLDYVNCGYYEYNAASAALQKRLGFLPLSTHYFLMDGKRVQVVENILYRRNLNPL